MKTKIFTVVFALGLLSCLQAQVIQGTSNVGNGLGSGDMMFGVKAGFGFSTFLGNDFVNISPQPTFYVGGISEIPVLFDGFYFQPEAIFQFQGGNIGGLKLNLFYLHVPLMGKYHITDTIAVEFGPQVGFLLANGTDQDEAILETEKINVGLNIGGGYRLNDNFYFNLRVGPGLTKVIEATDTKNFSFQIGANYFF